MNARESGLIDLQWVRSIGRNGTYDMRSSIGSQRNPVVLIN